MNEWISVKDALPKDDQDVLVSCVKNIYIIKSVQTTDRRHKKREGYFEDSSWKNEVEEITYWMPLPELPKDQNEK